MLRKNYRAKAFCPDWDCWRGRAQEDREWIKEVTEEFLDYYDRRRWFPWMVSR